MPNILDAIQVSGASYDLKDKNAPSVSSLTQSEYDNLPSTAKTSNTFFVITDAQAGDLTNYYTKSETNTLLGGKQDTLVSSTNIKTINNESILGSGNIDIQGGGGGKAIEAGRGIAITTGETADTVSFSLPISAGTGIYSIIEGHSTIASGSSSHAEGSYTKANGDSSHAEGDSTKANGEACHAEGIYTQAIGNYSHAEGISTKANGIYSHTEGANTIANNTAEHASGRYNNSVSGSSTFGDSGNTLFSVGNGTSISARHNAFEIRQNGDIYLSSGGTDIKLQDHLGSGGGGKAIEGGRGISITTGETADTVSFSLPISAGTGSYSIIEGRSTIANGDSSHAEGAYTKANGMTSHAEGVSTKANGEACHAEGIYTQAIGNYSHAEGVSTKANNKSEHASGQYNNSVSASTTFGDSGNTLFSVGNGTADNARHNAFEIRQNGDMYLNNGTSDIKLQDYLQIKVVKLTQSAYDALSPNYDSNTLYIIKD